MSLIVRQWLFFLSLILALLSSFILGRIPHISKDEMEVLFILAAFFVAIAGMERSGLISGVASWLERRGNVAIKLILITFLLALFVTNDVALLTIVPLTLRLDIDRKDLLVTLETIAANGAVLFPFSSPQNLYIYWHYGVEIGEFTATIAPLAFAILLFVLFALWFLPISDRSNAKNSIQFQKHQGYASLLCFLIVVLAVVKAIPLIAIGVVFLYALVFDTKALLIDYWLLGTFLLFFAIADNLSQYFVSTLHHPHHLFLVALGLSQLISNVPATLILADLTSHWQSLLWGVNVGGYGMLWGSLASLVTYRLYSRRFGGGWRFLIRFLGLNFLALGIGAIVYFLLISF